MGQAAIFNDGSVNYGSVILSIGGNSYIADDLTVTRPTGVIDVPDELGAPAKQAIVPAKKTGTATLQVATAKTVPYIGTVFSASLSGSLTESFIITEVSQPLTVALDYHKANISFVQKLN